MGWRSCAVTVLAIGLGRCDGSDGSDGSHGSCVGEACIAREAAERWWESAQRWRFRSPNVMQIGTLNFNQTVTQFGNDSLLIAFYDPRSESFRQLLPIIEDTADALAKKTRPIGYFGAVDVTVHSYLAHQEAPELERSWQDAYTGPFRFERPRYFPLILLCYRNGSSMEYKGVVKKKDILEFLKREMVPKGALQKNREDLDRLLRKTPGPFVLGCGFEGEVEEANFTKVFQAAANVFSGEIVFAQASVSLCSSLRDVTSPSVLYIRTASTTAAMQSSTKVLLDQEAFIDWLYLQRPVLLKEITPDNSWVFLERLEALVIYLVDAKDLAERRRGEAIFSEIEDYLEAKYYQLTWADCVEFREDFGIEQCPAVLVVDTDAEDTGKQPPHLTWQELLQPTANKASWSKGTMPAERLRLWLEEQTVSIRKRIDEELAQRVSPSKDGSDKSVKDPKRHQSKFKEEIDDAQPDSSEDFLNEWEEVSEGTSVEAAYEIYQVVLMHMTLLRQSFQDVYGLPFDFSPIERAQQLHKHMRLLVSTTQEVQEVLRNTSKRLHVWRSIEQRLAFLQDLESASEETEEKKTGKGGKEKISKSEQIKIFKDALIKGCKLLREVFRSLFQLLHGQAGAGALGDPPLRRDVPRRTATELSLKEFIETYAKPGLPVIITGLNVTQKEEWNLQFFRSRCNVSVQLHRRNPNSNQWGRLENAGRLFLADFIDTFTSNATRRKWYLHDWSLPRNCPEAFGPAPYEGFTVPKYFAGDYFQRAGFEGYQHSWPSLFIGSNETQSSMHIDSGNTHFMLHLLSGRKEWRFYSARDLINLYMSPVGSRFHYDVFRPDHQKFPLARYAEQFLGIQEPGETIFIPAANPHAVRNLDHIHGVSMNYVDASNIELSILQRIWEMKGDDVELYTDGVSVPHGLVSEQEDMNFGEWKAQDWKRTKYDLF